MSFTFKALNKNQSLLIQIWPSSLVAVGEVVTEDVAAITTSTHLEAVVSLLWVGQNQGSHPPQNTNNNGNFGQQQFPNQTGNAGSHFAGNSNKRFQNNNAGSGGTQIHVRLVADTITWP